MRSRRSFILPVILGILLAGAGCAPPFPEELLRTVDRSLSLERLRSDPGRYRGTVVMFGGMIVDVKNTGEGTFIEVLQQPLDRRGRPERTDQTEGRFLARSGEYLDSAVYLAGRDITIVGEVSGERTLRLGEIDYRYPVITIRDLRLWEPSGGPRVHFSIGIWHQM